MPEDGTIPHMFIGATKPSRRGTGKGSNGENMTLYSSLSPVGNCCFVLMTSAVIYLHWNRDGFPQGMTLFLPGSLPGVTETLMLFSAHLRILKQNNKTIFFLKYTLRQKRIESVARGRLAPFRLSCRAYGKQFKMELSRQQQQLLSLALVYELRLIYCRTLKRSSSQTGSYMGNILWHLV